MKIRSLHIWDAKIQNKRLVQICELLKLWGLSINEGLLAQVVLRA